MPWWVVPAVTGAACLWTAAAAHHAPTDRAERIELALLLTAIYAVSVIAWLCDSLDKLALLDGAVLGYAGRAWRTRRATWRLRFAAIAAAQLALDCLYEAYGSVYVVPYAWAYDATFFAELAIIGGEGSYHVGHRGLRAFSRLRHVLAIPRPAR